MKVVIPSAAKRSRGIPLRYLYVVAVACSSHVLAAPPPDFDARVESLRKSLGVPGVAIAIVEPHAIDQNPTTYARGITTRVELFGLSRRVLEALMSNTKRYAGSCPR